MHGITHFSTFLLAGILLNLTPGADTMYILGRSLSNGRSAGILSALGISTGTLIHCLMAVMGLSVILAKSAFAFSTVKYLGAAYLVFLGVKALLSKNRPIQKQTIPSEQAGLSRRIYLSGIFTNLLNPKVALFFLAFLPQFVLPEYQHQALPFLLLGLTFVSTGTIWCLVLAFFAATLSGQLRTRPAIKPVIDKLTGILFISLGIRLAFTRR